MSAKRGRPPLLTPEFPAKVKPARIGVYLTRAVRTRHSPPGYYHGYSLWDGCLWHVAGDTPEEAASETAVSSHQRRAWIARARKPS